MFKYGFPIYDKVDYFNLFIGFNRGPAEAFVALIPEPSEKSMMELLEIYKVFPTNVMFYGSVAYIILVVLELSEKA